MKSFLLSLFLFCSFLGFSQKEQVKKFDASIKIDTTAKIHITENIDIVSAGQVFKRGIVRFLPLYKEDSLGNKLPMNYDILSVKKENKAESFHTKRNDGNLEIYVGSKDSYITDGEHHYTITYTAENTLGFYSDFDELYWNVNGFGWDFPIEEVTATVYLPKQVNVIQNSCYTGKYGSVESNCEIHEEGNLITFSSQNISSNENLSIAVGFEKGVVNEPPPPPPPTFLEKFGLFILALVLFFTLGIYYLITWRKHGVDPPKPTVYPQFHAPENLSPASVGILHKESYWRDLITSSIVNLAVKGFLQIEESSKKAIFGLISSRTFTLKKTKDVDDSLPEEEKEIMENLFSISDTMVLDGKYNSKLKTMVEIYQKNIEKQHKKLINEGNNYRFLILPFVLITLFVIIGVFLSLKTDSMDISRFIFGAMSFFPFIFFGLVITIKFMNWKWFIVLLSVAIVTLFIVFSMRYPLTHYNLNIYSVLGFLSFGVISIALYQYFIKRPSEEKLRIQSLIDGFKMYLSTAETRQMQHFNPPEITPEVFEKYLPYAIALDADEVWGKKFQEFIDQSSLDKSSYNTSWYAGSQFNAMNFGHMLNSNLSNSISSSSTPPSSSSSGSGGGGFSGGGGGGGGGGGW